MRLSRGKILSLVNEGWIGKEEDRNNEGMGIADGWKIAGEGKG